MAQMIVSHKVKSEISYWHTNMRMHAHSLQYTVHVAIILVILPA